MSLSNNIVYYLHQYWIDIQDPRTRAYPLVDLSPWTMANVMLGYYFIVTKIGPQFMKNRSPFKLREVMFMYNSIMVLFNAYFCIKALSLIDYGRRLLDWEYPNRNDFTSETLEEIRIGYWCWISKFADWFDTIFYVLRKKDSHVTFLHLYHHISVPTFGFLLIKINPLLPCAFLFVIINSFIHCVMYSYYALSALGPNVQKYLWWKRYITLMQLTQFVICMIYGSILFCKQNGYPPVWLIFGCTQPPLFFMLFYNWYQKTYNTISNNNNIDLNPHKPYKYYNEKLE